MPSYVINLTFSNGFFAFAGFTGLAAVAYLFNCSSPDVPSKEHSICMDMKIVRNLLAKILAEIKSSKYMGRKALKQLDEKNSEHLRVLGDLKQDIQNLHKGSDGVAVKIPSEVLDQDLADMENLVKECADREQDLIRIQNLSKDLVCPSKFRKIKSKRKKSMGRNVEDIKVSKILEKKNSTFPNDEEAADENGSIGVKPRTKRPCEVERIPSVNEKKVITDDSSHPGRYRLIPNTNRNTNFWFGKEHFSNLDVNPKLSCSPILNLTFSG